VQKEAFSIGPRIAVGSLVALTLIVGLGGAAAVTQIAGAVVSPGTIVVDENLKAIQHLDGGIVSEITVREGDVVKRGQVLLRLDDAQTRAEQSILQSQLAELSIHRSRLLADRDGLNRITFLPAPDPTDTHVAQLIAGETRMFLGGRLSRESQKQQLELGIQQIGDEVQGLAAQRVSNAQEIDLVQTEYGMTEELLSKKLVQRSRLLAVDRERAQLQGKLGEIDAAIARSRAQVSEIKLKILAIDDTARNDAQRELTVVETRLSEVNERLTAVTDRLTRTDIRAPIDGTVNELNFHTIGGVISPAQVLATIVPLDAKLNVRIRLAPTSIDQVAMGQTVRIRFPAFNQQTTPDLHGTVAFISPATSRDEVTGEPFYYANIDVSPAEEEKLGGQKLLPGMPVETFVTTQDRTIFSYFAKPLADRFNRAFRER